MPTNVINFKDSVNSSSFKETDGPQSEEITGINAILGSQRRRVEWS